MAVSRSREVAGAMYVWFGAINVAAAHAIVDYLLDSFLSFSVLAGSGHEAMSAVTALLPAQWLFKCLYDQRRLSSAS